MTSPEYLESLERWRAASAIFRQAGIAYREGRMSELDYLAARKTIRVAEIAADAAEAKEQGK